MICPHCNERFESALALAHHVDKKHPPPQAPADSGSTERRKE